MSDTRSVEEQIAEKLKLDCEIVKATQIPAPDLKQAFDKAAEADRRASHLLPVGMGTGIVSAIIMVMTNNPAVQVFAAFTGTSIAAITGIWTSLQPTRSRQDRLANQITGKAHDNMEWEKARIYNQGGVKEEQPNVPPAPNP